MKKLITITCVLLSIYAGAQNVRMTQIRDWPDTSFTLLHKADSSLYVTLPYYYAHLGGFDTSGKWISGIRRLPGSTTVQQQKGGIWSTAFIDSVGVPVSTFIKDSLAIAVISISNAPPVSPVVGYRYLVGAAGTGTFALHNNQIALYTGTGSPPYLFVSPTTGKFLVNQQDQATYVYDGTNWVTAKLPFLNGLNFYPGDMKLGNIYDFSLGFYTNNTLRGLFSNAGPLSLYSVPDTQSGDSALFIHNGEIRRGSPIIGIAQDSNTFKYVLDSTGAPQNRVLFAVAGNRIGTDSVFLFDPVNHRQLVGYPNITALANNIKLGVNDAIYSKGQYLDIPVIGNNNYSRIDPTTKIVSSDTFAVLKVAEITSGTSHLSNDTLFIKTVSGGVTAFTGLSDVPSSYSGQALKSVRVNSGATGLEFYTPTVGTVTSIATTAPITGGTITSTGTIGITQSTTSTDGYLSSTDWNTFNSKVPTTRTLTINGTALDLSADRSWTISTGSTLALPAGQIARGTGTGIYSDTFLIADTSKHWLSINRQTPRYTVDINPTFPGTVAVTNGSTTVTGTGTRFTSNFKKGDSLYIAGVASIVSVIQNDGALTLNTNYGGTTNATASYTNKSTAAGLFDIKANQRIYSGGYQLASWGGQYGNTSFGLNAAGIDSSGTSNTAFGFNVLQKSTGTSNTAVGSGAMTNSTTGGSNTAIGLNALQNNSSGGTNTAIGGFAGQNISTGGGNTAIGYIAMSTSNNSSNNTAIGIAAGRDITGANNTFIGSGSGTSNTSGSQNTGIGRNTLNLIGSSNNNLAIGDFAVSKLTSGTLNAGIGYRSMDSTTTGDNNTYIGSFTGYRTKTGSNNVGIGNEALSNYNTGSNNIAIGFRRTVGWNTSNTANIASAIWITGYNSPLGVDTAASTTALTGINTASPVSTLDVGGSFGTPYVAKTATYTVSATDNTIDCTSGTFTVTLPTAIGITGRIYTIVNSGSGAITIATTGSQTFTNITSAPTSLTLAAVGAGAITSYTVKSTGAAWVVTGKVKNE